VRPVNLIPPEERRGELAPLRTGVLSYAIVGVLGLALLGVVAIVLTGNSISEKESDLASLEARKLAADQRAHELAPYGELAALAQSRTETVVDLAESRFDWERVMNELALVIPENVWLDSLTGTVSPGVVLEAEGAGETATDPSITGPSLQISGCATGQVAVAGFIAALKDIDGVTRVGMQQSSLGELGEAGSTGGAAAAPASGVDGDCQTREFIAAFDITVAFDAVPVSAYTPGSTAVPATAPATTTTEDDGGTAEAETEQQAAEDSAAEQSEKARSGAETVGVGG
jgi:Tfp pilus assembly protein PilN